MDTSVVPLSESQQNILYLSNMPYNVGASTVAQMLEKDGLQIVRLRDSVCAWQNSAVVRNTISAAYCSINLTLAEDS
jgi:16S rRNA A1518/A1519 N6-dimethyltransferase RsmA/KsgA/DIM1 with predicted DNA glycosylase/AP lyase activity